MNAIETRLAQLEAELKELKQSVRSAAGQLRSVKDDSTLHDVIHAMQSAAGQIVKPENKP